MTYLVTGATGFIGRHLLENLLKRKGTIYCLVRRSSKGKLEELAERLGAGKGRIVPVVGDLDKNRLGIAPKDMAALKGKIKHFFHLAAIYDVEADLASQMESNVEGTRRAVNVAEELKVGCFQYVSSIAVAGLYPGVFKEDMFEEAENIDHPYLKTKHLAEKVVREECSVKYRIYRPSFVIGHSKTGEIDKIDGPYFFFRLIKKIRSIMPQWMPTLGIEGGRLNMVPVDYVVDAMDHIAHKPGLDGGVFHLTDPDPRRIGEVLNIFSRAANAPEMTMRIDARMFGFIPAPVRYALGSLAPVKRFTNQVLKDLGIPRDAMKFVNYPTRFDNRECERALRGSKIKVPDLEQYAWRLWDFWERNLDPDLFIDRSLSGKVKDKVVMVTGGSSGIGKAAALKIAEAGAKVIIVARKQSELDEVQAEIQKAGGICFTYSSDLAEEAPANELVQKVLAEHGGVDILINNAGRSIRRSIALSYDRFHDFTRTMELNYYGSLRLILGFLPSMTAKRKGHVINISSIGVLANSPRFSAYVASKSALDAFSRCAQAEFSDAGITFTTINMPLVRTDMIAPTKMYDNVPTLSPDEAADLIVKAIIERPSRVATRLGIFAATLNALAPKAYEIVMNTAYNLFPDSAAAQGKKTGDEKTTNEQAAFAALMRGVHW